MGGTLPGRGHGNNSSRTMHSPRMVHQATSNLALPEDIAKEQAIEQAMAEQRRQMIIQVRTQSAIEIMAALVCQTMNANVTGPNTCHLKKSNELDVEELKSTLDRAAVVATYAADALVCEMYGVTISRQPIGEEESDQETKIATPED